MNKIIELWDDYDVFILIPVISVLVISFFVYDVATSTTISKSAIIIEGNFSPSTKSTTIGMAYTNKGSAPVVATSGHDDEYSVVVEFSDKHFQKIGCTISDYYNLKKGESVEVEFFYGGITSIKYGAHIKY